MNEIAIASVPIQEWEKPYELKEAFHHGSIFPQLHKPFYIEEQRIIHRPARHTD